MDIESIEAEYVNYLKEAMPDYEVIAYPDEPMNYKVLNGVGAILVRFDNLTADRQNVLGQPTLMQFVIVSIHHNLRSHLGAYQILENIRQTLADKQIGVFKAYVATQSFLDYINGFWYYETRIMLPGVMAGGVLNLING